MHDTPETEGQSRRDFLRSAAATAAAGMVMGAVASEASARSRTYSLAPQRVIGANDRINIAVVGLGSQGFGAHVRLLHEHAKEHNTAIVALCDLYGRRLSNAAAHVNLPESARYWDYRKLLSDAKDVDAVFVATSDNWHAPICVDSMEAGKHVYCEKPMCKTLEETFGIFDTVKKTGKVFQVGSQGCSDPKWHLAAKLIKEGKIGHVVLGQGSYMRNGRVGEWNNYGDNPYKEPHKSAGPNGTGDNKIDWETFRRGKLTAEYDPDVFFRWRKYWAIGSGLVGDLFPHRLHPLYIAMALPVEGNEGWPWRVSSNGGLYVQKVNPDTGKPDRDVPDFTTITCDFGSSTMIAMSSTINEQGWPDCVRGNKGTIYFGGNTVEIKPERVWADEVEFYEEQAGEGENIVAHQKNFFDCIRTGGTPNAHIELAARVQTMITLAELSYRNNVMFTFDPATRKATPDVSQFPEA